MMVCIGLVIFFFLIGIVWLIIQFRNAPEGIEIPGAGFFEIEEDD